MRFTNHALERMEERGITRSQIEAVIASPDESDVGESAVEYGKTIDGRDIVVVVARGSEPPLIITVMLRYD